ncbi:hypothetical protein GCM10009839_13270 [Catenulispora yoronensis]|uniref:Uncharacterized protein n=1 Tax=Catenulispora yoronensis TaxID=450799 RepID=A0ABN2TRL2_9ACTN
MAPGGPPLTAVSESSSNCKRLPEAAAGLAVAGGAAVTGVIAGAGAVAAVAATDVSRQATTAVAHARLERSLPAIGGTSRVCICQCMET